MERGAWWAIVYRVTKSRTGLKWLRMHNSYAEILTSTVSECDCVWRQNLLKKKKKVNELKWGCFRRASNPTCLVSFYKEEIRTYGESHVKVWGKTSLCQQGERPWRNPLCLTPCSRMSGLQNCEKIHFHCLSHPVCGICYGSPSKLIQPMSSHWCLCTNQCVIITNL